MTTKYVMWVYFPHVVVKQLIAIKNVCGGTVWSHFMGVILILRGVPMCHSIEIHSNPRMSKASWRLNAIQGCMRRM